MEDATETSLQKCGISGYLSAVSLENLGIYVVYIFFSSNKLAIVYKYNFMPQQGSVNNCIDLPD